MTGKKVLIIGIDAFDPEIADFLLARNLLPNFRKIRTYCRITTTVPPETPVAWTAASTGMNPGKTGIFDFIHRDPDTYVPHLSLHRTKAGLFSAKFYSPHTRKTFWEILSRNNIPSTVIRWPLTFPANKLKGKLLSGLGTVDLKGLLSNYSFYTTREISPQEPGYEKIIPVVKEDQNLQTYISGPYVRTLKGYTDLRTEMNIVPARDAVKIQLHEKEYEIRTGEWSPYIRVSFRKSKIINIRGILRFYLNSVCPDLEMFATSVQIDPESQVAPITYPDSYGKQLTERIGLFSTLGMPEDTKGLTEGKLEEKAFLEQINYLELEREKMFWYERERWEEGVLAVVFDSGDRLQHVMWGGNKYTKSKLERIDPAIASYYIEKDKFIGEVLGRSSPDIPVLIFSDHGFTSFEKAVNMNAWLIQEGFMKIRSKDEPNLMKFVDWENTVAYSIGFTGIYLNQKGREKHGIVSAALRERIIAELLDKLVSVRDGGQSVFTQIYRKEDIYSGKYLLSAPDLILGFAPGYRMGEKNVIGSYDPVFVRENDSCWCGDHLVDRAHVQGVLFTNLLIEKKNPEIYDIAPTVLHLFGIPAPVNMDGKSLLGDGIS